MAQLGPRGSSPSIPRSSPQRWVHSSVVLSVLVLNLLQSPGRVTFDSKLDLQLAPWDFMVRSLSLWNPRSSLGEIQNQATGFLFPMGTWFAAGDGLGVPMWVWERLWSALVMLAAYEGARRLARAWGGLGAMSAVVVGLAYMLAPRVLSTVGALTGEALPTAVLPWTILPLVLALRRRIPPWQAALLSAATVPFMGGQNATEVLATLVLPFLVLVFSSLAPRTRLRLTLLWLTGVVVASLWWLVPLLLLGRYSPPFLDYIESARNTTDLIGWFSVVRGTDHWVAYLPAGASSSWQAGWLLVSRPSMVVATALVGIAGLVGLGARGLRERRALLVAMVLGFFVLTAGSGGWPASVLGTAWTNALDGPLAPFRNVHKFDPLVRWPLSLGLGFVVQGLLEGLPRRLPGLPAIVVRRAAVAAVLLPLLATTWPAVTGHLRDSGGFTEIASPWRQTTAWLDARPRPVRTLVVPGAGFAVQTWGRTIDEPVQVLDPPAWSTRNQTPLAPGGTVRWLDSVEGALVAGRPSVSLAPMLDRAGITYLVVRNDLDYGQVDSPRPEVVHAVIDRSPGFAAVARFGDAGNGYAAVEVYAVNSTTDDPRVALWEWADRATVQGAPEAVGQLTDSGVVGPDQAMVIAPAGSGRTDVLTDTDQRAEQSFGRVHQAVSEPMSKSESFRATRPAHAFDDHPDAPKTVARYHNLLSVTASTSAGYADTAGAVVAGEGPYSAIDGSGFTSWATSPLAYPRGQWIELRFAEPVVLGPVSLQFDVIRGARVHAVRLVTDHGLDLAEVDDAGRVESFDADPSPTRSLRVVVAGVGPGPEQVRLADLRIGGRPMWRTLVLPGRAHNDTTISLQSPAPRRACFPWVGGVACGSDYQQLTQELGGFRRTVDFAEPGVWDLTGLATATGGAEIDRLFDPPDPEQVRVFASSSFAGDPQLTASHVFDGQLVTSWMAAPGDTEPVLELRWAEPRLITRITASSLSGAPGRLPASIRVITPGKAQTIDVGDLATGQIEPVRTTRLRLVLKPGPDVVGQDQPVAISELNIDGLEGLRYSPDLSSLAGAGCGFGPRITIAGTTVSTRVSATLRAMLSGAPVQVVPCGDAMAGVAVPRGRWTVHVTNPGGYAMTDLTLTPRAETPPASTSTATTSAVHVGDWSATHREVEVYSTRASVLTTHQSLNDGWVAEIDGRRLAPVELDGWMQGWRVPAHTFGTVSLRYAPQGAFAVGLAVGLTLVVALLLLAGLVLRRLHSGGSPAEATTGHRDEHRASRGSTALVLGCLALVSIPAGAGGAVVLLTRDSPRRNHLVLAAGLLLAGLVVMTMDVSSNVRGSDVAHGLAALAFGIVATVIWRREDLPGTLR